MLESLINAASLIECEDPGTMAVVRGILDLFPAKKHLGQALADLLMHYNEKSIEERGKLEQDLQVMREKQDHQKTQGSI